MFRGITPGFRMGRRKGQHGGRRGRKLEEKGPWGGGCPPGGAEREETPQRQRGGRDKPGQGRAGKGKERKTSRELQVGGSQPPFSSPIPLFRGSCCPLRKRIETRTRMGARRWAGKNAQVLPGLGGSEGTEGSSWRGGGKGQHGNQGAGGRRPAGSAPGAGGSAAGRHLLPLSDSVPPDMAAPPRQRRLALPAPQRSIPPAGHRGHSRNKGKPRLASAPGGRSRPAGAGRCRGGGGGAVGRGAREKMAAWRGRARRPNTHVLLRAWLLRSATQAELTRLGTPAPGRSRGEAGGGFKGDAAFVPVVARSRLP